MIRAILPSAILIFSFSACKSWHKTPGAQEIEMATEEVESSEEQEPSIEHEVACLALYTELEGLEEEDLNASKVLEAVVQGNCLKIKHQYSGCNEGEPLMVIQGQTAAKRGSVLTLSLRIRGAGPCEMLIETEEYFSLDQITQGPENIEIMIDGEKVADYRAY